jgi:hypothetical protein
MDDVAPDGVLGLRYAGRHDTTVVFANIRDDEIEVRTDALKGLSELVELAGDMDYGSIAPDTRTLRIRGHGYRWLRGRHDG